MESRAARGNSLSPTSARGPRVYYSPWLYRQRKLPSSSSRRLHVSASRYLDSGAAARSQHHFVEYGCSRLSVIPSSKRALSHELCLKLRNPRVPIVRHHLHPVRSAPL